MLQVISKTPLLTPMNFTDIYFMPTQYRFSNHIARLSVMSMRGFEI